MEEKRCWNIWSVSVVALLYRTHMITWKTYRNRRCWNRVYPVPGMNISIYCPSLSSCLKISYSLDFYVSTGQHIQLSCRMYQIFHHPQHQAWRVQSCERSYQYSEWPAFPQARKRIIMPRVKCITWSTLLTSRSSSLSRRTVLRRRWLVRSSWRKNARSTTS